MLPEEYPELLELYPEFELEDELPDCELSELDELEELVPVSELELDLLPESELDDEESELELEDDEPEDELSDESELPESPDSAKTIPHAEMIIIKAKIKLKTLLIFI